MLARIKHIAISSDNYPLLGRFYEALFGLQTSSKARPEAAVVLSDGYIGMNINPRPLGCIARLDHFGFEVPDPDVIAARVREAYPAIGFIKRPVTRPFAGFTMHDPSGIYFDLGYPRMEHTQDVYADASLQGAYHPRRLHHFQIRVLDAPAVARCYRDVFELTEQPRDADDFSVVPAIHGGLYAAPANGCFERAGLDVELANLGAGIPAQAALLSGELAVASVSGASTVNAIIAGGTWRSWAPCSTGCRTS